MFHFSVHFMESKSHVFLPHQKLGLEHIPFHLNCHSLQETLAKLLLSKLSRWEANPPGWQIPGDTTSFRFLWIVPILPYNSSIQHWGHRSEGKVNDMHLPLLPGPLQSLWVFLLRTLISLRICPPSSISTRTRPALPSMSSIERTRKITVLKCNFSLRNLP